MIRRKKLACLGLAASMALPAGVTKFGQLFADRPPGLWARVVRRLGRAMPTCSKLGIDQYNQGQYEQSVASLQEVDIKSLSQQDHQTLVSILGKAREAATEGRAAREELLLGEEARKANNPAEAEHALQRGAQQPAHADAEIREKAQQQLAVVQAVAEGRSTDGKATYKQAVNEYRKGLWNQARADFIQRAAIRLYRRFPRGQPGGISPKARSGRAEIPGKKAIKDVRLITAPERNIAPAI